MAELCGWGERAKGGVVDDFVDRLRGFGLGIGFGQVDAGGLEAVEEDAGAAGVQGAGGEVLNDEADGELDGGTVLGHGQIQDLTCVRCA